MIINDLQIKASLTAKRVQIFWNTPRIDLAKSSVTVVWLQGLVSHLINHSLIIHTVSNTSGLKRGPGINFRQGPQPSS